MNDTDPDGSLILRAALDYLSNGFSVIPVIGKLPALKTWQRWQTNRADPDTVRAWFTNRTHRDFTVDARKQLADGGMLGVAIVTGAISNAVVVDLDGGPRSAEMPALPETLTSLTGRPDGQHRFLRHYGGLVPNVVGLRPGVDVRGDGGYVVVPPSPHPSGVTYRWQTFFAPETIAECPTWLRDELQVSTKRTRPTPPKAVAEPASKAPRHGRLSRATRDFLATGAPTGERNVKLFAAAADMAGCRYTLVEATAKLMRAATRSGFDASFSEPDAHRTILSAFASERAPSRPDAFDEPSVTPVSPTSTDPQHERQKDWGHAVGLWTLTDDLLRWANHRPAWMEFAGAVWEVIPESRAIAMAANALRIHYASELADAREKEAITTLTKAITETCIASKMAAALRFYAGRRPVLVLRADEWDAHPWLLNLANGTLDLHARVLRPHAAGNLITRLAPTRFDPDAAAPLWEAHLAKFLPLMDVRRQVQRDLGRALVGTTLEETLSIWYGTGANGKTTTSRVLTAVLGNYVTKTASDLLIEQKHEQHPTAVADLIGTRLAFAVEPGERARLAETLVKDLTGGDRIKTRYMRGDFFEAERTFDLILVANHEPAINSTDEGIWRRIRKIPWGYAIPATERRPQEEVVAELMAEASGILNWLLDGLADWQADHHWVAGEVRVTTDAYRADQDVLADFLNECCEIGARYQTGVGELYEKYLVWSGKSTPLGKQTFGRRLRDRGFTQTHTSHKHPREWVGLRIGGTGLPF